MFLDVLGAGELLAHPEAVEVQLTSTGSTDCSFWGALQSLSHRGGRRGGPQICAITMLQPAHLSFLRLLRNYPLGLVGSHPAEIVTSEKVEVRPQCLQ